MTPDDVRSGIAAAYDATGAEWEDGPGRIYNRLAEHLVAESPIPLAGRRVLDLGAGTGAASRAVARAGGHPIGVDVAVGILRAPVWTGQPRVAADLEALPLVDGAVDGAVAAFSFNHVPDPTRALAEAARVCRPGSPLVVSAYAADDDHPVKAAVDEALAAVGWEPPAWYCSFRRDIVPLLATVERAVAAAATAGVDAAARVLRVPMGDLGPADLVAWRLGMAAVAPFVARLAPAARRHVERQVIEGLGADAPPLVRSIVVLTATV